MEKKTAEDILESTAGHPLDAMNQYAKQEVEAYKEELASLKEENAKLKGSMRELLPIVEFFTVSHLKEGEIWMNRDEVINRAKSLLR